jgi:hypothetical protein
MEERITVYANGAFGEAAVPEWLTRARAKLERSRYKPSAEDAFFEEEGASGIWSIDANQRFRDLGPSIKVWKTPDGGLLVEMFDRAGLYFDVLVTNRFEWLPFWTAYAVPFLKTFMDLGTAWETSRMANALMAYARHGGGTHIDEIEGTSNRDAQS